MTSISSQKNWFTAIRSAKKMVPSYFEHEKHYRSYQEREKIGSLLFGD